MNEQRLKKFAAALVCMLVVACDEGPTSPRRQVATPLPMLEPYLALKGLAGSYNVVLNVSEQCTEIPDAARRRTYQAILGTTPYPYLSVRIVGGGFSAPVAVGDLRAAPDGRVTIDWNNFDIGGCDGYPEPLSEGRTLMVCGQGFGMHEGSTISIALTGRAWIDANGTRGSVCNAWHQFTFTRSIPSADLW
jgi:hypothetical protein